MTVKTITITEDAYESIKRLKRVDESFSDLFRRISNTNVKVKDLAGALKMTDEEREALHKRVRELRAEMDRRSEERMKDVRARLQRFN